MCVGHPTVCVCVCVLLNELFHIDKNKRNSENEKSELNCFQKAQKQNKANKKNTSSFVECERNKREFCILTGRGHIHHIIITACHRFLFSPATAASIDNAFQLIEDTTKSAFWPLP